MNSHELIERCETLSYRKLDYWCAKGVFSPDKAHPGRSTTRQFSEEDLRVATVITRISNAFDNWSHGRGGMVAIYREAANQIRAGANPIQIDLGPGIQLTATVPPIGAEIENG